MDIFVGFMFHASISLQCFISFILKKTILIWEQRSHTEVSFVSSSFNYMQFLFDTGSILTVEFLDSTGISFTGISIDG